MRTQAVRLSKTQLCIWRWTITWWRVSVSVPSLLLVILLTLLPSPSRAATYYWNPAGAGGGWAAGADTNNGTSISTPWKSLKKVRDAALSGGNTVNVKVGNYVRSDYQALANDYPVWTQIHSKGSSGAPLIIQSDPAGGGTKAKFDGQGDGLWVNFAPTGAAAYYILIQNIEFTNYAGGVIGIGNGSTAFGGAGIASRIAVVGNYLHDLTQAGAASLGTIASDHIIFKDNTITTNAIGYTSGAADHVFYLSHGSQYVVVDHNYTEKIGGYAVHGWGGFDASWSSQNLLIRKNTFVNAQKGSVLIAGSIYANTYVYHNTLYVEAASYPAIAANSGITATQQGISFHNGQTSITNTHVKNNLSVGYVDSFAAGGFGLLTSDAGFNPSGAFELDYNWWAYLGGGGSQYRWLNTPYTTNAAFVAATPYGDNDKEGDPKFTNPAAGVRDFTLQTSSTARNVGTTLTTTTNSGTVSTSMTVADTGYFHDGYGLIQGDVIQVNGQLVTIASITSSTAMTLASPATWTSGQAVSLPYNGSAPDMGAFESVEPVVVTPQVGGVDLDGIDDYLDMTNAAIYENTNSTITVTGYFQSNNDAGYVFAKRTLGTGGGYFLRINADGTATARLVDSVNGASAEVTTVATTHKDGQRHCFVVVYTTSTTINAGNQVTLYIDGVLDGPANGTASTYNPTTAKLVAGALSDLDSTAWLNGSVDDLRIWAGGFSSSNAVRYCAAKIHYFSIPLASISYWPLDSCAEGSSAGGVSFPDRMKGGASALGVVGGNGTGLTCHGSSVLNYPASVQ